tara:strand:+ start:4852 stop:5133 length:282 start_codon:yes stop_codon:yes gene_type:complete
MELLNRLKALFSSETTESPASEPTPGVDYKGFLITPAPIRNGNLYRVAAMISKGEKNHHLIRADELGEVQECIDLSLRKARLTIDQQGEDIFL